MIVIVSIWVNLGKQWINLRRVKEEIADNRAKIINLSDGKKAWIEKIKESTSSAYLEREVRDKLGMGRENDYWIIMPEVGDHVDLYPKTDVVVKKAVWKQWWEMFVAGPGVEPGL